MLNRLKKLFESSNSHANIVRFIRTEYANDVRHMTDNDAHNFYLTMERKQKCQ